MITHLQPNVAANQANETPILPEVASHIVSYLSESNPPKERIQLAGRSFIDPVGLSNSALA